MTGQNRDQRNNVAPPQQNHRPQEHNHDGQGNNMGPLLDKQYRMLIERSTIIFVGDGMLKVSVGQMVITLDVAIAEVITPRMTVGNLTRSLICPIM